VADRYNCAIRKIDVNRMVTTLAGGQQPYGSPGQCANVDGAGGDARFGWVESIAVGPTGDLFVADRTHFTIRRVTSAGVVTTVAGTAGQSGTTDGPRETARLHFPTGVSVASDGAVYLTDASSVRQIAPDGTVTTVGGGYGTGGHAEGLGAAARFGSPRALLVDPAFHLYIADTQNQIIVKGTPEGLSAPAFTTPPANTSVPSGGTATFTVAASGVPAPTFTWEVSTNGGSSYSALANGSGASGATTATLTWTGVPLTANGYRVRAIATNVMGTATSTHAVLTVTGVRATPARLVFAVYRSQPTNSTPPQRIEFAYSGPGTASWSVSSDQPWLLVSGTTTDGASTGAFIVSFNRHGIDAPSSPTPVTATITATASNVGASVQVPVTLRLLDGHQAGPVIGQVDTPVQNANGVQGAIGVTGWALHPVGVQHVGVYRNCIEGAEPCVLDPWRNRRMVFIGHAVFVPGARPDIEAAFPEYPAAHIGGWGLQILTNQLPRTTGTFAPNGGQGPITLYVLAHPRIAGVASGEIPDTELSRAWTDLSPVQTTLTLDNDAIAKPFGTIDTPASAATVSGTVANFGWALTPDTDTTAGTGDILIPTNGSSMVVFIDGIATAQAAYNQCRGTVGNPMPAGAYCNDDIASIFGNPAPQEALGTRTSNPTRYRNLDAARGAIGAYNIDTTLLSNGLHTIAWSVTDSAGRVEGIGSRYFTVLNGAADVARTAAASAECSVLSAPCAVATADRRDFGVLGRTGFDLRRPWTPLHADVNGIRHVRIPIDNGRVELSLGTGIEAGYLEANGERRPLPPGSAFDPATGIFTWAPGPGYLGTYRLVFGGPEVLGSWGPGVRGAPSADFSSIAVDVTLRAETRATAGDSEIRMHLDSARVEGPALSPSALLGASERSVRVEGWAFDPQAEIGAGIGAVHIWARRVGPGVLGSWSPGVQGAASPVFLGAAALDIARPDVAAAHGAPFGHAGFRLETTATLPAGEYEITAYVWNWRTARWEDARSARVTVR
jgi:hypothetical protein